MQRKASKDHEKCPSFKCFDCVEPKRCFHVGVEVTFGGCLVGSFGISRTSCFAKATGTTENTGFTGFWRDPGKLQVVQFVFKGTNFLL